MLSKLALRNAKRCFRDYIIYLITITLAFALIFSFNLLLFSKDIKELSNNMESFEVMIVFISILIVFIIGILINYMNKFIFEKRSREFGTYLLLGIEKKKIAQLFLVEQIILGLFSLILAFILGTFLSQIFTAIIMNIFNLPYIIKFNFTIAALLLTCIYFSLIYLFTLYKSNRRIKKMNIYDLIYFDKINEVTVFKKGLYRNILFVISVVLGVYGIYIFNIFVSSPNNFFQLLESLILLIISIYGISMSLPHFLLFSLLKIKHIKYKSDHLFILRHLTSKINTIGVTMGTLTVLIAATLVCLNFSNIFTQAFIYQTDVLLPYDIKVTNESDNDDFNKPLEAISDYYTIQQQVQYHIYADEQLTLGSYLKQEHNDYYVKNRYIKLSDYNKLINILGMPPISLNDNEYYINCATNFLPTLKKYQDELTLSLKNSGPLTLQNLVSDHFTNLWSSYAFVIIVPDALVADLEIFSTNLIVDTLEETDEDFYYNTTDIAKEYIISYTDEGYPIYYYDNIMQVRGYYLSQNRSAMTVMAFSLLYVSFIFIAVTGTILAIQCLTDSTKNIHRYRLLHQLGMDKSKINMTIFKQLALTFIYPVIYPIIICIFVTIPFADIFSSVLPSINTIWYLTALTGFMFGSIYFIYFMATYIEFKNNITFKK